MIGQQIDVIAGDFNGIAWWCSNRDNISIVDVALADCASEEAFADCFADAFLAPHHCVDPGRFQATGLTSVGSLSRMAGIGIGKYARTVPSPSHLKVGLRPTDQNSQL